MGWSVRLSRCVVCVLLVWLGIGTAATAAGGTLSLLIENDSVSHTDRYYSHGLRIGWLSGPDASRACGDHVLRWLPFIDCKSDMRWLFDFAQAAFTPLDLGRVDPDPADRPYAGWLYASGGVAVRNAMTLDQLTVSLGVVGPASQAEDAQRFIHRIESIREPRGWNQQLKNEPTLQAFYQRLHRTWHVESTAGYGLDVLPHYGAALGNVYVYANTGAALRFGKNLRDDFGPPRMQPGAPGADYAHADGRFGWYVFAGVDGRAMLRNLFLDGNTNRDGPSVDRNVWVGDMQVGLMVDWEPIRIGYTHVWRSREFRGQRTPQAFGAFSIAVRF